MSSIYDDLTMEPAEADLDVDAERDAEAGLDPDPVVDGVARLLELAVQNADELLAEANTEADKIEGARSDPRRRAAGEVPVREGRAAGGGPWRG